MASKPKSPRVRTSKPKVRQIKVNPTEVVELKLPKGLHPVILQKSADTVEIIPVPKSKKQGWLNYLFGDWTK